MTKAVRCDRCNKIEDANVIGYSMGFASFYIGGVTQYRMGEAPDIHTMDLCKKCQAELNEIVTKFMEE